MEVVCTGAVSVVVARPALAAREAPEGVVPPTTPA